MEQPNGTLGRVSGVRKTYKKTTFLYQLGFYLDPSKRGLIQILKGKKIFLSFSSRDPMIAVYL